MNACIILPELSRNPHLDQIRNRENFEKFIAIEVKAMETNKACIYNKKILTWGSLIGLTLTVLK